MSDVDKINEGGHAFPVTFEGGSNSGETPYFHTGMTLRDWFAGQAISGIIANPNNRDSQGGSFFATEAYAMADAMLAARGRNP